MGSRKKKLNKKPVTDVKTRFKILRRIDPVRLALLNGFEKAWNSHDVERLMKYYAPNITYTDPALRTTINRVGITGKNSFRNFVKSMLLNHPEINYNMTNWSLQGLRLKGKGKKGIALRAEWIAKSGEKKWSGVEKIVIVPTLKPPFFKIVFQLGIFDPRTRLEIERTPSNR